MESVSWVTEDCQWEREWVKETNVVLKENDILEAHIYDIDVPCPTSSGDFLWFSAPSKLNSKFVNSGSS